MDDQDQEVDLTPAERELLESITLFSRPDEIKTADEAQKTTLAIQQHIERFTEELNKLELPRNEIDYRIKEEKVRVAKERLEKSKIAQKEITVYWGGQKVSSEASQQDVETSTDIIIDTTLDAWEVCRHVASKNCLDLELAWSLVIYDSEKCIMRTVEDHENIYEIVESWKSRNITSRKLFFRMEDKKYHLFDSPAAYFNEMADDVNPSWKRSQRRFVIRRTFLTKYYRDEPAKVPSLETEMYIRTAAKKWKKVQATLTDEGLFYEKPKEKYSVPYILFKKCKIFETTNYDGLFKAPTAAVIAMEEDYPTEDYIKAICFENRFMYITWYSAMRMGSYSNQLLINWDSHIRRVSILERLKERGRLLTSKARRRSSSINPSPSPIQINLQRGADFHLDWSHREADWYHGKLSRIEQQTSLEQLGGKDGLYLVRESSTSEGQSVLVVCSKGNIMNFLISETDGGYTVGESSPFPTMQQLIDELKTSECGLPCCLTSHAPLLLSRVLLRNVAELEEKTAQGGDESDKEE